MRLSAAVAVDSDVRDQLVLAHVELVRTIACRLRRRLPAQVELSELVSVGVMGLMDAASRYQPSLGVPFDAFARRRIHGAMLDALRSLDTVPRSARRRQRAAEAAIAGLRQTLGREPEAEEIAAELGLTAADYERFLDESHSAELAVARSEEAENGTTLIELVIDPDEGPHHLCERRELKRQLADALRHLPERERQILSLSYVQELTLAEIGRVFHVGESRVSQLRTQAIMRLRSMLRPWIAGLEAR